MKIGFIGLGIMGSRMAANLLKSGYSLIVFNRTKEKATQLIDQGAKWANSPKEIALNCDVLITMLSTPEIVKSYAFGKDGFIQNLADNNVWINCSTVNPSFTKEMNSLSIHHKIKFIDAPVAGTKAPAEKGELLFLVGGNLKDINEIQPLLDVMGKKTIHLGEHGKGSKMKMLINLLLAQSMVAFAEAMSLGEAMGLEQQSLFDILTNSPVTAPFIKNIRPKLESENYEPNFPLKWIQKDLHLASITAYENNATLPSLNIAKEIYAMASNNGYANNDFSAIYDFFR